MTMPVISKEGTKMFRSVHLVAETAAAVETLMKEWGFSSLRETMLDIIREDIECAGLPAIAAEPYKDSTDEELLQYCTELYRRDSLPL